MGNLLAGAAFRKITPSMDLIERITSEGSRGNDYDAFSGAEENDQKVT